MNRIDALRTAMVRRAEHLRTVSEDMQTLAQYLPSPTGSLKIDAAECERRELSAYRSFFDSFLPEPINVDVKD